MYCLLVGTKKQSIRLMIFLISLKNISIASAMVIAFCINGDVSPLCFIRH